MFPPTRGDSGLLDLLGILLAVAIVAVIGLAYLAKPGSYPAKAQQINCVNNLKQIGLSYRLWSGDNGDKYPAQVSTNAGGTLELVASGLVFPTFAIMSNELATPKLLVCPQDVKRSFATNFRLLRNANLSYFTVPEADETIPELWLSGDRNLATNNVPLKPGLFMLPTNRLMSWTAQIHKHRGNLAMSDGSVQQFTDAGLQQSATNALRAYYSATTNSSFRLAIPDGRAWRLFEAECEPKLYLMRAMGRASRPTI